MLLLRLAQFRTGLARLLEADRFRSDALLLGRGESG